jgi:hypothetical protein
MTAQVVGKKLSGSAPLMFFACTEWAALVIQASAHALISAVLAHAILFSA